MGFSEVLQELRPHLKDCVGLVVMGMDGIAIEKMDFGQEFNFEALSAECTTLLRDTRVASENVGTGNFKELIVMTEKLVIVTVAITEDYVLLGALRQGCNYGQSRYYMKRASLKLVKEFD